jgi:hypothetical protein
MKVLKGIVYDPNQEGVFGARAYISDESGVLKSSQARTNPNGSYALEISGEKPTHLSVDASSQGLPLKTFEIASDIVVDDNGVAELDLIIPYAKGVQEIAETVVTANPNEVECIKMGGFYNEDTNTCTLPPKKPKDKPKEVVMPKVEKSWFAKNWWWLAILTVGTIGGTIYYIKNKNKTK